MEGPPEILVNQEKKIRRIIFAAVIEIISEKRKNVHFVRKEGGKIDFILRMTVGIM